MLCYDITDDFELILELDVKVSNCSEELIASIHSSLFTKTNKNQFGKYFNALAIFSSPVSL